MINISYYRSNIFFIYVKTLKSREITKININLNRNVKKQRALRTTKFSKY